MTDEPKKPEEEKTEEVDEEELEGVKGGAIKPGLADLNRPISPLSPKKPFDGLKKDAFKE